MEAPLSQDLQLKSHWLRQLDRLKSHCLRCLWWCWCILCVFFFSFCSRKRLGSEGSQVLHSHGFTVDIVLLGQSQCWFVQNHCGWVFSKSSWPSLFDMFWPLKVLGVYILHSPFSIPAFPSRHLPFKPCHKVSRNVDFCFLFSTYVARDGFLCCCPFWKSETK